MKAIGQSIFGSVNRMRCTIRPPAIEVIDGSDPFRDLCLYTAGDSFLGVVTMADSMRDVVLERWEPGLAEPGRDREFELTASCYDFTH